VPIGPNQIVHGYFTADKETAAQWARAEDGTLTPAQALRFRSLMAHEYVERHSMAAGMPYRSAEPQTWVDGYQDFNAQHFGAHDVAPRAFDGTITQWHDLGLTPPDDPIAPDLSNIDNVVEAARRGLHL
jgi:hypothetical protein